MTELIDKKKLIDALKKEWCHTSVNNMDEAFERIRTSTIRGEFDAKPEPDNRCCILRMYEGKPCETCKGALTKDMICRFSALKKRVEKLEEMREPVVTYRCDKGYTRSCPYIDLKNFPLKGPCTEACSFFGEWNVRCSHLKEVTEHAH